jgi:hypothetical protein
VASLAGLIQYGSSNTPLQSFDTRMPGSRNPNTLMVNRFEVGGAAEQIKSNFDKPNGVEPILLPFVEKSFFESGNSNSGSTTVFKMDPNVAGLNFFMRAPTSGPHAVNFSPEFTKMAMDLIGRFNADVPVARDLKNFLQYVNLVEKISSEVLVQTAKELSTRYEFKRASVVHMNLLSLSQGRLSDPASSLPSVNEWIYVNQVGGIAGLAPLSFEIFLTAFNPLLKPETRMQLGNLLQFKPEPTAGPMITATQFNEEYEFQQFRLSN